MVERLEDRANSVVVLDHAIGVFGSGRQSGLVAMRFAYVCPEMHASGVKPAEKWPVRTDLPLHEIDSGSRSLVVDRFHAFPGKRPGILDLAIGGRLEHAARTKFFPEVRMA